MSTKTSLSAATDQAAIGSLDTPSERKARPTVRPPLPEAHTDVAMIDMNDFAALARMSPSWIYSEVAAGRAPKPLRFGSRCTRWKLSQVRAYLIDRADKGAADTAATAFAQARALKASAKARKPAAVAKAKATRAAKKAASTAAVGQ